MMAGTVSEAGATGWASCEASDEPATPIKEPPLDTVVVTGAAVVVIADAGNDEVTAEVLTAACDSEEVEPQVVVDETADWWVLLFV